MKKFWWSVRVGMWAMSQAKMLAMLKDGLVQVANERNTRNRPTGTAFLAAWFLEDFRGFPK